MPAIAWSSDGCCARRAELVRPSWHLGRMNSALRPLWEPARSSATNQAYSRRSMGTIDCSVDRLVKLAPIGHDQRMVVAQQLEYLQQRLVRQAVGVAAVAHEEPEQRIQRGFVLLARQLLDGELIGRLVVLAILRQATLEVGDFRQVVGLAQEGQLRACGGQRLL